MNIYIKLFIIEWRTPYPLTTFEDRFGLRALVIFFLLQYVWCAVHLYTGQLPNSCGQFTELIHIIPPE